MEIGEKVGVIILIIVISLMYGYAIGYRMEHKEECRYYNCNIVSFDPYCSKMCYEKDMASKF